MSEQLHEQAKRLPFSKINAGQLRHTIVQNLKSFERKTGGYDWIALWDVPRLLGIKDDDLVFLLVCRLVPSPELLEDGLFFHRSTFLAALQRIAIISRPFAYIACFSDGSLEVPDDGEGEQ